MPRRSASADFQHLIRAALALNRIDLVALRAELDDNELRDFAS